MADPGNLPDADDPLYVILPDGFELFEDLGDIVLGRSAARPALDRSVVQEPLESFPSAWTRDAVAPELERDALLEEPDVLDEEPEEDLLRETELDLDEEIDEELAGLEGGVVRRILARATKAAVVLVVLALPFLVVRGWSYYSLSFGVRPFHPAHAVWRPSGFLGLLAGMMAAALLLASLSYVLIKALLRRRRRLGSLPAWMTFHIATGVLGFAFALVHSGFHATSALGLLALGSMIVVLPSGMVGRYLLVYMPRAVEGNAAGLELVRRRLTVYKSKLVALGFDPGLLGETEPELPRRRSPFLITAVARVLIGDRESREQFQRLRRAVRGYSRVNEDVHRILVLARRLCRERQLFVRYYEMRKIVGTWRFLHRWLAVVLLFAVVYHVLVAVQFGDLWILGGTG